MSDQDPEIKISIEPVGERSFGPEHRCEVNSHDAMLDQLLEEFADHEPTVALIEWVNLTMQENGDMVRELHVLEPEDPMVLPHPVDVLIEAAQAGQWVGAIVCYRGTAQNIHTLDTRSVKGTVVMLEEGWRSWMQVGDDPPERYRERPAGGIADAMAALLR